MIKFTDMKKLEKLLLISNLCKEEGVKLPSLTIDPENLLFTWIFTPEKEKLSEYDIIVTYAFIQKWFRDEHNISIEVFHNKEWFVEVTDTKINYFENIPYDSYEEALYQGIIKAFKLT